MDAETDSNKALGEDKTSLSKIDSSANVITTPTAVKISSKGVENAKKRLRAFSIQKKTPITPIAVPKPAASGNTTVIIGKLTGVKVTPKPDESDVKKPPKPPKPGSGKKYFQDSYSELQKRTLAEIEDMKRKMELVELGIPLGLICPSSTSETAMPTKAMPPIKSFLDPEKLDEIIRQAKKAKAEGRVFKFDYQKLLPDYDNPFQTKKKDESSIDKDRQYDRRKSDSEYNRDRKSDKHESKRSSHYRKEDKYKHRYKEQSKREKDDWNKKNTEKTIEKETNVNLNDYLICDSWTLDNDDKNVSCSPKNDEKHIKPSIEPVELVKTNVTKPNEELSVDSPKNVPVKIEKLQPVIDSFEYEIDPNDDDEILDIFDEDTELEKFSRKKIPKQRKNDTAKKTNINQETYRDTMSESINDDTFLESIINEIKQEGLSDDDCSEKGLVEYDISPIKDDSPKTRKRVSGTPDIDDRIGSQSQRSDYSGYTSTDSYRTVDTSESGYKSVESYRLSVEKELDVTLDEHLSRSTVDSLETWSFVLKICQPLLFRHDKNKCYKETRTVPKLWYTENPKKCKCVKDRVVVYKELEMGKMNLVDRVYGCDQLPDSPIPNSRNWYPKNALCATESTVPVSIEWEAEDSQQDLRAGQENKRKPMTPQKNDDISLDREYQRFMEAVWPEVTEPNVESIRSTTPVRQEVKKKRKEDQMQRETDERKIKRMKLNSEDWSQDSEIEDSIDKSKKIKEKMKSKLRKRKQSTSTESSSSSDSDDSKEKSKAIKKKALKKVKSKLAKRRRMGRKILKKLKEKQKKKKAKDSEDDEVEDRKKYKKYKKKKQLKLKKKASKKKKSRVKSSSSSDSSSSSETDSESDKKSKKAKRKSQESKLKKSKKRKQSISDSTQSEDLFDVNILNNIKTERVTDDEENKKMMEFSPRRQSNHPREIINVKELQNDFVGSNIQIKKEVAEDVQEEPIKNIVIEVTEIEMTDKNVEKQVIETSKEIVSNKIVTGVKDKVSENKVIVDTNIEDITEIKESPKSPVAIETKALPEESNVSQSSSQESICSVKEPHVYEKDDSYLRPSSQNSNYSFNDVISANSGLYPKHVDVIPEEEKYTDGYETGNYEMYEHLAMAYQSDVASQRVSPPRGATGPVQRIETVVHVRSCGEIKCDWRPGAAPMPTARPPRPSRWGLKPGEVNIVLTGGSEVDEPPSPRVYPIQSLANRTEINTGYDEAYLDMYGASDRLQYGDCFSEAVPGAAAAGVGGQGSANITVNIAPDKTKDRPSTLDARIDQVLKETVLGDVAKETEEVEAEADVPDKGILMTVAGADVVRAPKRVSFADGYTPGQDSDVEEPPAKKRKKVRRVGCAWPCPASHPDHVPLWDALPPPPPPPGSPPRRRAPPPPTHAHLAPSLPRQLHPHQFDPMTLSGFPPEPPPALVALH